MSEDEIEEWKNKWLPKGLPEGLLDEMIQEAKDEWTSILQWSLYDRYAMLAVKVIDNALLEGEFYVYLVQRADEIFRGIGTLETEHIFAQIPTVEIVVSVYKLLYDGDLTVKGFGWQLVTFTKDAEITIEVKPIAVIFGYGNVEQTVTMLKDIAVTVMPNTSQTSNMSSTYSLEITNGKK